MQTETVLEREPARVAAPSTSDLCDLAARGLVPMLDPDAQIFCDIYNRTAAGMVRQGLSPRYTTMTLLGLHRYERSGRQSPVAIVPVLDALLRDTKWINGAGDLGLLLWTLAEIAPDRLPAVYEQLHARAPLEHFLDARLGYTMEVAWYLTGLAYCCLAGYADLPGLVDQATNAQKILAANRGASGVYGHLGRSGSWAGRLRGGIGTFADQVYPTIALARWSQAQNGARCSQMALRTAQRMCDLQGPLGEWPWRYDSRSGKVISRYPVYSVHQHAMAPMMLQAAGEAAGADFREAIDKGLAWISGQNELGRNFIEPSLGLVWRSIYLDAWDRTADAGLRYFGLRTGTIHPRRLKGCYDCRPYELGWLLYAFAG